MLYALFLACFSAGSACARARARALIMRARPLSLSVGDIWSRHYHTDH